MATPPRRRRSAVDCGSDATDGVADFRNPANRQIENSNVLVTSCIQVGKLYFPYHVATYIGEEEAPELGERFRTKLEIALEDIIEPLQLPAEAAVTVVADSAYYDVTAYGVEPEA